MDDFGRLGLHLSRADVDLWRASLVIMNDLLLLASEERRCRALTRLGTLPSTSALIR